MSCCLPLGRRGRRGCRARRRRGRQRRPPRAPAAGRTARTHGSPARRRGTPPRPRPASGGAMCTISPGSRAGTPPCPGHLQCNATQQHRSLCFLRWELVGIHECNSSNDDGRDSLTFAYLRDVEVEPADEEVSVLDLLRHCCCLLFKATYFISFCREGYYGRTSMDSSFRLSSVCSALDLPFGSSTVSATRHLDTYGVFRRRAQTLDRVES